MISNEKPILKRSIADSTKTVDVKENENDYVPTKKSKTIETSTDKELEQPSITIEPTNSDTDKLSTEIFENFKKIFPDIKINDIHHYHICSIRKCKCISKTDIKKMTTKNKFQHKWLTDPELSLCSKTNEWCLTYIDGKGMFCALCRKYNVNMSNGLKTWNSVADVRYRTEALRGHLQSKSSSHEEAAHAHKRISSSYFDKAEENKEKHLKNEVYHKVFHALYWIGKEELPTKKLNSFLETVEKMGLKELKYFETRSEPILRKMMLMLADTIVCELVEKIKASGVFGLLTDEVTDISNICQLVSFIKYYDEEKGTPNTVFIDCSDLLSFSADNSPNAEAIVSCLLNRFEQLKLEISKLQAFASDGASVMTGAKAGVAARLKILNKTLISIHCICHRLALACSDTGDEFNFIKKVEEALIELWKFYKNSPKRLKEYMKCCMKFKDLDTSTKNGKKVVKRMKKACRTRWLSLGAGVEAAYEEYEGIITSLREIEKNDKKSSSLATGLLKKVLNYEFIGSLYLLKFMLPHLNALSKVFQTGSLNFAMIIPSIQKCKANLQQLVAKDEIVNKIETDVSGRLKKLDINITEHQKQRIKTFPKKYADSICKNIEERFPESSCKVLESFSIFNVDLIPNSSTNTFKFYGNDEIDVLGTQFFPDDNLDLIKKQWEAFKYHLVEIRKKYITLKKQFTDNKLKLKKTSTEWTLNHIIQLFKDDEDHHYILQLAKIAAIIPVTNAWPERGASAVKRIKTKSRNSLKNDLLNALMLISINGPPVNTKEADEVISRAAENYSVQKHRKVPSLVSEQKLSTTKTCSHTQTDGSDLTINVDEDNISSAKIDDFLSELDHENEFLVSNFIADSSDSEESESEDELDDI